LATVYDQRVADSEGSRVRAQPEDGVGDLLGRACPSDRLFHLRGEGEFLGSTPALLKATSSRPKASIVFQGRLAVGGLADVAPDPDAFPPRSSIIRAVAALSASETSVTTTLAPSRAKASAAARPMPPAARVTNATLFRFD
jgi:hypothetical protein